MPPRKAAPTRRKAARPRKTAAATSTSPIIAELREKLDARPAGKKGQQASFELSLHGKGDIRVDHDGNGFAWLLNDAHDVLIALSVTWLGEELPGDAKEWCREAAEELANDWRPRDWEPIDSDWDADERCLTLVLHKAAKDLDAVAEELVWAIAQRRDVSIEPLPD